MEPLLIMIAVGILAGSLAHHLPMSGKAALALTAAPILGLWFSLIWC